MRKVDRLRLQMDTRWGPDLYGRPSPPHPLVAFALADDGREARFGADVPPELRPTLQESLQRDALSEGLERVRQTLTGSAVCRRELSYVFQDGDGDGPLGAGLEIVSSEKGNASWLNQARPEPWGDDEEWDDLLAGKLGPWAFGLVEGRVESVCYTPVASSQAAEAGIWTRPEARGKGYAPAVVAAWARVAKGRFGTLFYSTDSENFASQAVVRKLRLCPIGSIGQIRAGEP